MLIFVDDIIIASSKPEAVTTLIQQLSKDFAIKDLGELSYFLGVEAISSKCCLVLTQRKYVCDLLHITNMQHCKPSSTPMSSLEKLSRTDGLPLSQDDVLKYISTVGALQYLTIKRPDITFAINKVCQFIQAPTNTHWMAVKRLLIYIKGTATTGLKIHKSNSTLLSAFSNSDWAGCLDDRWSTSGYAICLVQI